MTKTSENTASVYSISGEHYVKMPGQKDIPEVPTFIEYKLYVPENIFGTSETDILASLMTTAMVEQYFIDKGIEYVGDVLDGEDDEDPIPMKEWIKRWRDHIANM